MAQPPLILVAASTEKKGVEFHDISTSLSERYTRSILAAGGLPVIAPCSTEHQLLAEAIRYCHGVMLTGGDDVNTRLYTQRLSPKLARTVGRHDLARDLRELTLIEETFRQRKPLLAICRGHQLLNVALGGTLIVDIPTQFPKALNHDRSDRKSDLVHEVQLTPDSLLATIAGKQTLGVNSSHHQAVARVAPALQVTGRSSDGVVEALEFAPASAGWLPYLVAVQYHPERLTDRYPDHLGLFCSFTRACIQHRNRKL